MLAAMSPNDHADVVLTGGAIQTMDAARSWARAIAVRGDRIAAVGTERDIAGLIGPRTRVIDLHERLFVPGFQDAHVHPVTSGIDRMRCDLTGSNGLARYLEIIDSYATSHPDVAWILGGGWSMDDFPAGIPRREDLDAIVPDRPVFLPSRDGHSAWVNSRALALARVTRDTADPADGRIEREPDGEPAGTLHEGAMDLVEELVPPPTQDDLEEGLRVAQAYLHALGITGWQDAIVGGSYPTLEAYLACAGRGELTARVVGALWWDRHRGEEQIEELIAKRAEGPVGRFSPTSVKIMQDGIVENFTAAVLEPYLDAHGDPTDNRGKSFVEPELLKRVVVRLDAEGFQVHFHALAERAVREALDAIEAARAANGMSDHRHHLAHLQIVHPDDIPRFRRLGAVANAQPLWAMKEGQMVNLTIPFLGPERSRWQYPFASLARSGAVLAFGSDWSVSSPNPLFEMHVAVNRRGFPGYAYGADDGAISEPFLPEQAIDLPTAIAAFTMGSAYVNHLDDVTGSIEVGKLADLVVLDRNVFARPTDELYQAEVLLTLVEGERVHAAGGLA